MSVLSAREGYGLWAPRYEAETVVSSLENRVIDALAIPTVDCRLLDVGCGTGRRLRDTDAAIAVGVDSSLDMLRLAPREQRLAAADVRALPFAAGSFDVVWCRLVIGHVRELEDRVLRIVASLSHRRRGDRIGPERRGNRRRTSSNIS